MQHESHKVLFYEPWLFCSAVLSLLRRRRRPVPPALQEKSSLHYETAPQCGWPRSGVALHVKEAVVISVFARLPF